MDTAFVRVQAYFSVNGYFTIAEYPMIEAFEHESARTATDVDILAFRFPGAGREVRLPSPKRPFGDLVYEPDAALATPGDRAGMIVTEVKERPARFKV